MKKRIVKIVMAAAVVFAALPFSGCIQNGGNEGHPKMETSHTLIMYLIGNGNGLQPYLDINIDRVLDAVDYKFPENAHIYIYFNRSSGNTLYKVEPPARKESPAELITVEGYSYDTSLSSTDGARIRQVVQDIKGLANTDTYGFVMGTHGMGWFPEGYSVSSPMSVGAEPYLTPIEHDFSDSDGMTRYFGPDGVSYGSSEDLVDGLSGMGIEYLIFDMCFMSSVELLYDLRGIADYIVASPAEIMSYGIPYHRVVPHIFSTEKGKTMEERLISTGKLFVDFYRYESPYGDNYRSAAITITDTSGLAALATAVKNIMHSDSRTAPVIENIPGLERLYNHAFFDLREYMYNICGDSALLDNFDKALAAAMLFEDHTELIYSGLGMKGNFDASKVCGISSYIPRDQYPVAAAAYYNTAWARYIYPDGYVR